MIDDFQEDLKFTAADDASDTPDALILDINGYEGPLHLLLELARTQKVDLTRLSILELAEQYLAFIKSAQDLRIELAADYLVMAAWLAYLKSKLMLPREEREDEQFEPEDVAAFLAFRLQRLEAMRRASGGLLRLHLVGRDVFVRGAPEGLRSRTSPLWQASLYDLLEAYGSSRSKTAFSNLQITPPSILSLEEARSRLYRALKSVSGGGAADDGWIALSGLVTMSQNEADNIPHSSMQASTLVAGLELAKIGDMELRQEGAFKPIYVRAHKPGLQAGQTGANTSRTKKKTSKEEGSS